MPRIAGTTDAQTKFLRAFKNQPFGPASEQWPSPTILRRWLRKPGFVAALASVRAAMRYQADFQLCSAAAVAAQSLHDLLTTADASARSEQMRLAREVLKLAHLRQRFSPPEPPPPPRRDGLLAELLALAHPDARVATVLEMVRVRTGRDLTAERAARLDAHPTRRDNPRPCNTRS